MVKQPHEISGRMIWSKIININNCNKAKLAVYFSMNENDVWS